MGYEVLMAPSDLAKLPPVGEEVFVHTYMQVGENGIGLYGFATPEEKALFLKLITVSGVGPKVALAALGTFAPKALAEAVAAGDIALVSKIPGVGKKTASRIVLELKGSLESGLGGLFAEDDDRKTAQSAPLQGATEALLSMGFTSAEAELALKDAPVDATESALLQYALKRLGS